MDRDQLFFLKIKRKQKKTQSRLFSFKKKEKINENKLLFFFFLKVLFSSKTRRQKRRNKELNALEYLVYAGGNESMWTNSPEYFNRGCKGTIFGKPCLVLKSVCWMNPWARLECVPVPRPDSKIDIYIYHMYDKGFCMNN